MAKGYLTIPEAAHALGMNPGSVLKLLQRADPRFPSARLDGGRWLVAKADVDAFAFSPFDPRRRQRGK